jgi:hypothetical protein
MFSWPPAITMSASPQRTACAASITAFRPEPHTLLIVIAGMASGSPALRDDWRAAFWPLPAVSTWPRITSDTASALTPVFASSARITVAPSSGAGDLASVPPNLPMAVRSAATMTTSVMRNSSGSRGSGVGPRPYMVAQVARPAHGCGWTRDAREPAPARRQREGSTT